MSDRPLRLEGTSSYGQADRRWQRKAEELRLGALSAARASAERWAGSLTAILGAVSLAALLEGPEKFNALTPTWEAIGKGAFFVAAAAGLAALWLAATTARVARLKTYLPTGPELKRTSNAAVSSALNKLAWSQRFAAIAVVLALVAAFCLWWGKQDPAAPAPSAPSVSAAGCPDPVATGSTDIAGRCQYR